MIELKVQEYLSTSQEYSFRLWLYNRSGADFNPEQYRVVVYGVADSKTSEINLTTETGFDRSAGLGTGGISFFTPTILSYETPTNPPYLGSDDASKNYVFTYHIRARFDCISGMPTAIPDDEGVSGMRIRVRRNDSKNYSTINNNTGVAYTYTLGYSYEPSSAYVYNPRVVLERNAVDPSDANSSNWAPVTVSDASGTPELTQPYYPYASDVNGSTHSATTTDHKALICDASTWVGDVNTTTNHGSDTILNVNRDLWNGSAEETTRSFMSFDTSVMPVSYTLKGGVLLPHTTSSGPNDTEDEIFLFDVPRSSWDENTLTWDTQPGLYDTTATWTMFSNISDGTDRSIQVRLDPAFLQEVLEFGVRMQFLNERTDISSKLELYSDDATSNQPLLFIRYEDDTPPSEVDDFRLHVW